ncbi:MAG: mechanosensitive ion channel [Candidatus Nanoarchaeia archaeon]|nr:mechanosensitive ion channel [Candidatus Nanoarchaeia archaeon]
MFDIATLNISQSEIIVRVTSAIVILFLGYLLGRVLSNLLRGVLRNLEVDSVVKEQTKIRLKLENKVVLITRYVVYVLTILFAMKQLQLNRIVIIVVLILGILFLLYLSFINLMDIVPNFFAGIKIKIKKIIKEGQEVGIREFEGKVIKIGLFETQLKHGENILIIPNIVVTKNKVRFLK